MELQGEFKKLRPPMFDGESKEAAKAWFLYIKWYFQVYIYDDNLRAHLAIFLVEQESCYVVEGG